MQNKICIAEGCSRHQHAKKYCSLHYRRMIDGKDLLSPIINQRKKGTTKNRNKDNEKQCVGCQKWLSEAMFKAHHSTSDRLDVRCKECETFMRIKRSYNISRQDIEKMLLDQNGCAICHYSENLFPIWWAVDHDHSCCPENKSCGKCVRGIVCSFCNRGLGQFKDSIQILQNAIEYIRKSKR